ncbi:response regulator [Myxococcota bacterium]
MAKPHILIVEDEVGIAESLGYLLEQEGFDPRHVVSLAGARECLAKRQVDLVILDLVLPDGNGIELLRQLRADNAGTPVIVLTSRDAEVDRVVGLELGADDYVTKPFSAREVVARVKAVLRRMTPPPPISTATAGLALDPDKRRVTWNGEVVSLTKIEFDLLSVLVSRPGQVFERGTLLDRVWGAVVIVGDRTVDVHVKAVRQKLRDAGADADLIETVRGVGYRLRE